MPTWSNTFGVREIHVVRFCGSTARRPVTEQYDGVRITRTAYSPHTGGVRVQVECKQPKPEPALGGGVTAIEQSEARPRGTRLPRLARRNQLLGAAQEVFVAQGYHAAAMDDIADRAGVSKPVLYQHFPGKLELYLALLDQHCESLLHAVRTALASTTDNKKRVEATMHAYFAYVEDEGGAFRLVFESDLTNETAVRERVDKVALECAEAISQVIAEDTGLPR